MADDSVSISEFARQVGKSAAWISKKSRDGTIPRDENGKIPLKAGFAAYDKMVKKEEAVKAIRGKTLPDDDDSPMTGATSGAMNVTAAFNKARLAEKTFQAKLKEIEYKLKRGELLERTAVEADAQETAAMIRERLMSVPVRIAGLCEGRTAREIEEIIEDGINEALELLQKSKFVT